MSIQILPASGRPQITAEQIEQYLQAVHKDKLEELGNPPLIIVGIRGYFYEDNKRGVYDDAIVLYVPSKKICSAFNGNTDPSRVHKGYGTSDRTKGMAVLNPGVWPVYRFDRHNGSSPHDAICQREGNVTVQRDGSPAYMDSGDFGINIHRGGFATTSSLGCQTIPPSQWNDFYGAAKQVAKELWGDDWKKKTVVYVLEQKAFLTSDKKRIGNSII